MPAVAARAALNIRRDDPNFVSSLAKGLEILSEFAEGELLGNQQLVERTSLPKATVSRLTSTLAELGYLRQDADSRKFFMGTRLLGMGASVQHHIGLLRIARPAMQALAEETGHAVALGTRDRLGVVLLEAMRPACPQPGASVVRADVGTVLALECTAMGLGYLVAAPLVERTRMLEELRETLGAGWPAARERIERAHAEFQSSGFVVSERSSGQDVHAVAVPLVLHEKHGLFVFNCAGPACALGPRRLRDLLGPRLRQAVREIRTAMEAGFRTRA